MSTVAEALNATLSAKGGFYEGDPFSDRAPVGDGDHGYYWIGSRPDDAWVHRQSGIPLPLERVRSGRDLLPSKAGLLTWHLYRDQAASDADVWATALAWNGTHLQGFGDGTGYIVTDRARVVEEMDLADDVDAARSNFRRDPAVAVGSYASAPLLVVTDAGFADPYKSTWRTWTSLLKACLAKGTPVIVTSPLERDEFCDAFEDKVGERRVSMMKNLMGRMAAADFSG